MDEHAEEKRTEKNLIVRNGISEAETTNNTPPPGYGPALRGRFDATPEIKMAQTLSAQTLHTRQVFF